MRILMTALTLGAISMLIVIIGGLTSGLVRLSTLALRALFAFAMASAASYFLMMLFDLYDEYTTKKLKAAAEPEELPVEPAAAEFEPLNGEELPKVER